MVEENDNDCGVPNKEMRADEQGASSAEIRARIEAAGARQSPAPSPTSTRLLPSPPGTSPRPSNTAAWTAITGREDAAGETPPATP
jgi:hypothetical protein